MASELKTQFEPPANRTPNECHVNWKCFCSIVHDGNDYLLLLAKLTFWAGIIKQLFGQLLLARYLIYLARENRYWAQLTLRSISALPFQTNQISDSSRPNNCILNVTLIRELRKVRYANSLPVCHSISSFDCALEMACSISGRGTTF